MDLPQAEKTKKSEDNTLELDPDEDSQDDSKHSSDAFELKKPKKRGIRKLPLVENIKRDNLRDEGKLNDDDEDDGRRQFVGGSKKRGRPKRGANWLETDREMQLIN